MKARKFVLIYFKTVKATQGKEKKIQRDTKSTKNEENRGCKTNLAKSLGAGYASYFKAVFCVRELWQFVI